MATRTQSIDSGRRPYRFLVKQFERMIETGAIPEGDDVELIRGRLYRMVKKEPHNFAVGRAAELLRRLLPPASTFARRSRCGTTGERSSSPTL